MSEQPLQGRPPSDTEQLWLDAGLDLVKGSLDALNDTAKNLLTVLGILSGLYFGAVKLDDPHQQIAAMSAAWGLSAGWMVALFALPLVFWLASATCTASALMVRDFRLTLDSPERISTEISKTQRVKAARLKAGWWLLLAGLLLLIINLVLYLGQ